MRSLVIFTILVVSSISRVSAQSAEFATLKPLSPLKVHTSSGTEQGSWIQQRDSIIVIHKDGLRRTISIEAIDSVQRFITNDRVNRRSMIIGGVIGAAAFAFFYNGLCDYNCTKGNIAMAGIGGLLGGVIGRTLGGISTAISGEWVTIYRRQ
jgi:hypothetical protein